jgi:hypothetical protein
MLGGRTTLFVVVFLSLLMASSAVMCGYTLLYENPEYPTYFVGLGLLNVFLTTFFVVGEYRSRKRWHISTAQEATRRWVGDFDDHHR